MTLMTGAKCQGGAFAADVADPNFAEIETRLSAVEINAALVALFGVNVKSAPFSAKGDGVTDDAAAIQAAINTAALIGCPVDFPPGTYLLLTALQLQDSTTLIGCGVTSILKAGANNINLIYASGKSHVAVRGLTFVGNNTSSAATDGNGIFMMSCSDIRIDSCWLSHFGDSLSGGGTGGCAILIYSDNDDIKITGNYITDGAHNLNGGDIVVYSRGYKTLVTGNWCLSTNSAGIMVYLVGPGARAIIAHNYCANHTRHGIMGAYGGTGERAVIISGNICIDCLSTGIYITVGSTNAWVVTGNIVHSCSGAGDNGYTIAGGIVAIGDGPKIITGNYVYNTGRTSIGVARAGFPGGVPVTSSTAIRVGETGNTIVTGNVVDTTIGRGIVLYFVATNPVVKVQTNLLVGVEAVGIEVNCTAEITSIDVSDNEVHVTAAAITGISCLYAAGGARTYSVKRNKIFGAYTNPSTGLFIFHAARMDISENYIYNFYYGIQCGTKPAFNAFGKTIQLHRNDIEKAHYGILFAADATDYGIAVETRFTTCDLNWAGSGAGATNWFDGIASFTSRKVVLADTAPVIGTWAIGDRVEMITPVSGGQIGWVCTAAPGTWKAYGVIA